MVCAMADNSSKKKWYDFQKIEEKWIGKDEFSVGNTNTENCFSVAVPILAAGYDMTVGQIRGFVIADALARFKRMNGWDVCFPLGWNSFTERIEKKAEKSLCEPGELAEKEYADQKELVQRLGISYNPKQEFTTADPDFVRWLHELFIKIYRADHIYHKTITVPWCPDCKTFLPGGPDGEKVCWRCGDKLGDKTVSGWYLNIGKFKEELRQDLDNIAEWPSVVRNNLRNLLMEDIALESWDCRLTGDSDYGIPIPISVCEESGRAPATFNEFSLDFFSYLYLSADAARTPINLLVTARPVWDVNFQLLVWWTLSKILADMNSLDYSIPFKEVLYRGDVQIQTKGSAGGLRGKEINPDKILEEYGSDVLRFLLLCSAPPARDIDWREIESKSAPQTIGQMLNRLYDYVYANKNNFQEDLSIPEKPDKNDRELRRKSHKAIKLVSEKIDEHKLDLAAHGCFSLASELLKLKDQKKQIHPGVQREVVEILLQLLSPFTPYICLELWTAIGNDPSGLLNSWPRWDTEAIKDEERLVVVQLNGKTRAKIIVDVDATEEEIVDLAKKDAQVVKYLGNKKISKVFFIKDKLLNLVARIVKGD